jgi:hypothetical protein
VKTSVFVNKDDSLLPDIPADLEAKFNAFDTQVRWILESLDWREDSASTPPARVFCAPVALLSFRKTVGDRLAENYSLVYSVLS